MAPFNLCSAVASETPVEGRHGRRYHRELVRRLFATATELIETAHNAAVAGQSGEIAAENHAEAARRVQATARDVAVLAEAAMIVVNLDIDQR